MCDGALTRLLALPLFAWCVASMITRDQCKTYDYNSLYSATNEVLSLTESFLLPDQFARSSLGTMSVIVDETSGQNNGGGTNPFGAYGAIFFDGNQILPPGVCDIPTTGNGARCGSTGWTDSFMLGPKDVMAFLICTPPPSKYFGHDLIIGTRFTEVRKTFRLSAVQCFPRA